ncbi:hypothetical protein T484DRAFT_1759944, partial [Baffinella frigidus]
RLSNPEAGLNFLFDLVQKARSDGQPTFFILEEFHAFAAHPRQSLIYNLLDMTQQPRMQTVVLAESSALSCIELLEKRVRSRFSGRQILFMPPPCPARALTILCDALLVPSSSPPADGPALPEVARGKGSKGPKEANGSKDANGSNEAAGGKRKEAEGGGGEAGAEGRFESYREAWNERVEELRTRPEMHLAVEKVRLVT